MKIELGMLVKCRVTGHKGCVTSIATYLFGCRRCAVQGVVDKDGKVPDTLWIDEPALEITSKKKVIEPDDNPKTGGPMSRGTPIVSNKRA